MPAPGPEDLPPDAELQPVEVMTLDEAVGLAQQLHRAGDLARAAVIYWRVLEADPDHAAALHFAGLLQHHRGEGDVALALMNRSIEAEPGRSDWRSNLGNVLIECGRIEDAITTFHAALALDPDNADAHNNLGVALRRAGRTEDAETSYRRAIAIDPRHHDACDNLGQLLSGRGEVREALAFYARARELDPRNETTRRLLVAAYGAIGDTASALAVIEEWLAEDPDHPVAGHLRAALSGDDVPERASDGFVAALFDRFAPSFDQRLSGLGYRAPLVVVAAVERACGAPRGNLVICDAGCGTGLCGPLLLPFKKTMVGVDLSEGMLAEARRRGCYDELVGAELTQFLAEHPDGFDLIVSADTLCYFGRLDDVMSAAAAALREGGQLVFTVEVTTDAPAFRLHPHGRYSHHADYVRRTLRAAGLTPTDFRHETLRKEAGEPVEGLVVTARKDGATHERTAS